MATTTRGFRYPVLANSPDVPRDIGFLAADIDAMYSATAAVSRPAAAKIGREHYATDTGVISLDTGSAWVEKGSRLSAAGLLIGADVDLYRAAAAVLQTSGAFRVGASGFTGGLGSATVGVNLSASGHLLVVRGAGGGILHGSAPGDSVNRFVATVDGFLSWSTGAAAADAFLYRSGVGLLKTDGTLNVGGNLYALHGNAQQVRVGQGGGSGEAGLALGLSADANLYRAGAGTLKTDGRLDVVGGIITSPATANQLRMWSDGRIYFGSADDTNLYRAAANNLKTDDSFYSAVDICSFVGTSAQIILASVSGTPTIYFGSAADANIQRTAAGKLETSGQFWVGGAQVMPPGVVQMYGGVTAPTGWLKCDGSAVSRTTYAALFAIIGTVYGAGDGSTTFNIPDLQGRMPVGLGTHANVDALGENDGVAVANRRPQHHHTVSLSEMNKGAISETNASDRPGSSETPARSAGASFPWGNNGSSSGAADAPPYLVLNFIIKT